MHCLVKSSSPPLLAAIVLLISSSRMSQEIKSPPPLLYLEQRRYLQIETQSLNDSYDSPAIAVTPIPPALQDVELGVVQQQYGINEQTARQFACESLVGWHWHQISTARAICNVALVLIASTFTLIGLLFGWMTVALASGCVLLLLLLMFSLEVHGYCGFYRSYRNEMERQSRIRSLHEMTPEQINQMLAEYRKDGVSQSELMQHWGITLDDWPSSSSSSSISK
jgi:hypothetical protein